MSEELKSLLSGTPDEIYFNGGEISGDSRTRFQKIMDRLFPRAPDPTPYDEKGKPIEHFKTTTIVVFTWKDRLRLLVSGKCLAVTSTCPIVAVTEGAVSQASFSVLPPNFEMPEFTQENPNG